MNSFRIVRPKLRLQITGLWVNCDPIYPKEGFEFMHVVDGKIVEISLHPVQHINVIPGCAYRIYEIKLPKCSKCDAPVEASRYKLCLDCWWAQDPRSQARD